MNRPSFVVVGAPKCGTTSLYHYLSSNPSVFLPKKKELHFFSRRMVLESLCGPGDKYALDGCPADENEYFAHYASASPGQVLGDISPSYFAHPSCFADMRDTLGQVRVVVMLRNPIDKCFSQYMHLIREARETMPFETAMEMEEGRARDGYSDFWMYKTGSLYAPALQHAFDVFGGSKCLVVFQEDFKTNPELALKRIGGFIGVDDIAVNTNFEHNRSGSPRSRLISKALGPGPILRIAKRIVPSRLGGALKSRLQDLNTGRKPEMPIGVRETLRDFFSADVVEVERILGAKVPWRDFQD